VKEIINLLLPANMLLQKLSNEGVALENRQVSVDRAELDSAMHLVAHAQLVSMQLREILANAQAKQQPAAAPRNDVRLREDARLRDESRVREEARLREELARKEAGETVRPLRSA